MSYLGINILNLNEHCLKRGDRGRVLVPTTKGSPTQGSTNTEERLLLLSIWQKAQFQTRHLSAAYWLTGKEESTYLAIQTGKGDLLLSGTSHPICLPLAKLKHIVLNMPFGCYRLLS